MKIKFCLADEGGCGYYRMKLPAWEAERNGVEIEFSHKLMTFGHKSLKDGTITIDRIEEPHYDVVVFQRPMNTEVVQTIPLFQKQGAAVVVELDDDFSAIDPSNISYRLLHPKNDPNVNWNHLRTACRMADWVTVSTPALKERYGAHGRSSVIRNTINPKMLDVEVEKSDDLTFGWSGTLAVHPHDLQETRGGIQMALDRTGGKFHIVGDARGAKEALQLKEEPTSTGWLKVEEVAKEIAKLNIGIVSLTDTAFNRAKSFLKGIEYAAVGVPFVASSLPEYKWFEEHGVGRTVRSPKSKLWARELEKLAHSDYAEIGKEYREIVREHHTIKSAFPQWMDAWENALRVRKS